MSLLINLQPIRNVPEILPKGSKACIMKDGTWFLVTVFALTGFCILLPTSVPFFFHVLELCLGIKCLGDDPICSQIKGLVSLLQSSLQNILLVVS